MEEKKHALLSASSSHKWLVCTPSARLEEQFPNKESEYMAEGTLAHSIAEFKVRSYFLEAISKTAYTRKLNKLKKSEFFNEEMLRHTDTYLEYIKEEAMKTNTRPFIAVEQKIDYSKYVPEGFGTADCVLISSNTLQIIDFKYGKGVKVEAEDNSQLKLYALAALEQFGMFYNIENIKLSIVQPRIDNISEYTLSKDEIVKWGNIIVIPQAQKAFMGLGEFRQGEHCRFCRAKGACEFRAKENMKVVEEIENSQGTASEACQLLDNTELSEFLTRTEGIEEWIKDLRAYALEQILKGENIQGYKAVEGKSNRKIVDIDRAFEILKASGIEEALLYERKPLTLTQLEKAIGKKEIAQTIGDFIEKPKGAPTLAKETDKREHYKVSATEEFKN